MYKYIITYRFSGTEDDPEYQKRRGAFLAFLQQHDFFDVDTMSTIFVKNDDEPPSLFDNLQSRMKESGCPFRDDDAVTVVIFRDDEKGELLNYGSGKLESGFFVPDEDFSKWWL